MKLLVSDYDKTLFINKKDLINNIEWLNKFRSNNNLFIIATGRTLKSIQNSIMRMGLSVPYDYIICSDGAYICDANEKVIFSNMIDSTEVNEISDIITKDPNIYNICYSDGHDQYSPNKGLIVGVIGGEYYNHEKVTLILEKLKRDYHITYRLIDDFFKIVQQDVSKGRAIEILKQRLGINNDDIYTIGNDNNDISMLQMFNGNIMANSINDVKKLGQKQYKSVSDLIEDLMR